MTTTPQDLFDRWVSEAIVAKFNLEAEHTKAGVAARRAKLATLLDCAAQLQCVLGLPGADPRDPGGLDEHFNRIADRAKAAA